MNDVTKEGMLLGQGQQPSYPDPHGEAAMLLIESLIHHMVSQKLFSLDDAMEVVEIAAAVEEEIAADRNDPAPRTSSRLLRDISASLSIDLPPTT